MPTTLAQLRSVKNEHQNAFQEICMGAIQQSCKNVQTCGVKHIPFLQVACHDLCQMCQLAPGMIGSPYETAKKNMVE